MEWRKHYTDMTECETRAIRYLIDKSSFTYCNHLKNKMDERGIKDCDINSTIKYGNIIEFHSINGDSRVLLRSNKKVGNDAVCVVLLLGKGVVVTSYKNNFNDFHFTLDRGIYSKDKNLLHYIN